MKAILDSEEARKNRLSLQGYHQEVDEFCQSSDHERIMVIAFEKESNSPAAMVLLKKRGYDTRHLLPLPHHPIDAEMKNTSRKLYWELNYCIRRADKRSMCLGDICISHGIQEVYNREKDHPRGATIFIWLMVAGGFKNSPALRLYLAHGFDIIGMYGTAVMMSLRDVREESVSRSLKQLVKRLESTFLLPALKQNQAPSSVEDSNSQEGPSATNEPTSQGSEQVVDPEDAKMLEPDSQHSVASKESVFSLHQESQDTNVNELQK